MALGAKMAKAVMPAWDTGAGKSKITNSLAKFLKDLNSLHGEVLHRLMINFPNEAVSGHPTFTNLFDLEFDAALKAHQDVQVHSIDMDLSKNRDEVANDLLVNVFRGRLISKETGTFVVAAYGGGGGVAATVPDISRRKSMFGEGIPVDLKRYASSPKPGDSKITDPLPQALPASDCNDGNPERQNNPAPVLKSWKENKEFTYPYEGSGEPNGAVLMLVSDAGQWSLPITPGYWKEYDLPQSAAQAQRLAGHEFWVGFKQQFLGQDINDPRVNLAAGKNNLKEVLLKWKKEGVKPAHFLMKAPINAGIGTLRFKPFWIAVWREIKKMIKELTGQTIDEVIWVGSKQDYDLTTSAEDTGNGKNRFEFDYLGKRPFFEFDIGDKVDDITRRKGVNMLKIEEGN